MFRFNPSIPPEFPLLPASDPPAFPDRSDLPDLPVLPEHLYFQLDENNEPTQVAGCPPDGFSATGQLWGNPLYRWDVHKNTGFEWWIKRLAHCFNMYDVVRIDHFRGFDEYYAIPYGDKDAKRGWWEKGPGMDLFRTVSYRLGHKDIIAEDLGFMTDSVKRLVEESGYPNMKVIEFAFDHQKHGNKDSLSFAVNYAQEFSEVF